MVDFDYRYFFDSTYLKSRISDGERKSLSRIGAYVRTDARSSLRSRKKSASQGQTPSTHVGYLKEFMYFFYDPDSQSVVIGPALLNNVKRLSGTPVPKLLEEGGAVNMNGRAIYVNQAAGRGVGGKFVSSGRKRIVVHGQAVYHAFPFMAPAYKRTVDKYPEFFRDMFVG